MLAASCRAPPTTKPPITSPPEPPQELLESVPFAIPREGPTEAWREARRLFFTAYVLQLQGDVENAIDQYQRSIKVFPTAEAHTFLGWTYSWMGRYDDAIREAQQAITLDPEYGNPYNDIGVYLKEQGKLDEAIPWLMKATKAKRYASPHYPWMNLGHIWVQKGEWGMALSSYEEMWSLVSGYPIPAVPALDAALFMSPEKDWDRGTAADQQAVKEAITRYVQAWNDYDADTLKDCSDYINIEVDVALLLHLSAAKRAGVTITVSEIQVLHIEDDVAIVEIDGFIREESENIWYLLRRINGDWKVVIRLFTESRNS